MATGIVALKTTGMNEWAQGHCFNEEGYFKVGKERIIIKGHSVFGTELLPESSQVEDKGSHSTWEGKCDHQGEIPMTFQLRQEHKGGHCMFTDMLWASTWLV